MKNETREKQSSNQSQLININHLMKTITARLDDIRSRTVVNSQKKYAEYRLAESVMKTMKTGVKLVDRETGEEFITLPSLNYYSQSVTRIRTAIKDAGYTNVALNSTCKAFADKYPKLEREALNIADKPCRIAEDLHTKLIDKISATIKKAKTEAAKKPLREMLKDAKKIVVNPDILFRLTRTDDEKNTLRKNKDARIQSYLSKQVQITHKQCYEQMSGCLSASSNWQRLAFGLALASGRRFVELVDPDVGHFQKAKREHEAIFTTTAKTKEAKTYRIPLLVDFETFIQRLEIFRSHERVTRVTDDKNFKKLSHFERSVAINNSMQKTLNHEIMKITGSENTIHDARAKHARLSYEEYAARERKAGREPKNDALFFKENLGHTEHTTQLSYKRYVLVKQLKDHKVKQEAAAALELIRENIDRSKNRLERMTEFLSAEQFKSGAYARYAEHVIEQVKADENAKFTANGIKTQIGGNKGIICKFVAELKSQALDKPL